METDELIQEIEDLKEKLDSAILALHFCAGWINGLSVKSLDEVYAVINNNYNSILDD